MGQPAIRVQNLAKQYRLGNGAYTTLRESIVRGWRQCFRGGREAGTDAERTLWALRDVGFEVRPGEVVGIVGRNGAGKSTLLKVLSRITEPTRGRVELRGRVASLLEVGTGFHPELTGRENVFLNGAILGMSRREVARKLDEIVAFAEVERFLDTPIKRYSSGMWVRLAFSVAAHLEAEILLVDEVLAVGDAVFQKKCLGKMEGIGREGRTVLFVSHQMPMILRLCSRALLLEQGRLAADGPADSVARAYLESGGSTPAERTWPQPEEAPGDRVARLAAVRVRDRHGSPAECIDIREPVFVEVEYWNLQDRLRPVAILQFFSEDGTFLFQSNDFTNREWWRTPREPGLVRATCEVPGNFLAEGRIFVTAAVGSYNPNLLHAIERDAVSFQVVDRSQGDGARGPYEGPWPGVVRPLLRWTVVCSPGDRALEPVAAETGARAR